MYSVEKILSTKEKGIIKYNITCSPRLQNRQCILNKYIIYTYYALTLIDVIMCVAMK